MSTTAVERRSGLGKILAAMPCAGEGCTDSHTCQHAAAAQLAGVDRVRMSFCPTTRDGVRMRYVPIPRIRSLDEATTDWGDLL